MQVGSYPFVLVTCANAQVHMRECVFSYNQGCRSAAVPLPGLTPVSLRSRAHISTYTTIFSSRQLGSSQASLHPS